MDDKRIIKEAAVALLMSHPNIVSMQEVIVDEHFYYLFFEYVDGGQLLDFIISHGLLNEKLARRFMRQIISAVDYCHQNSIVHRDLKIENILIDSNGVAKLIDFGLANVFSPFSHLNTFCGSLYFAAPELLSAKSYIGPEVDLWSLGVILYVLVCGKVPFDDSTMPALHAKIKKGHYASPVHLSKECAHLISRLLVVDPKQRASMDELKQHPWIMHMYDEPPDSFVPTRTQLTLPLDMNIIKKMKGFGFGTEADMKAILDAHIRDNHPQGTQQWLVGGRAMSCPESPLVSMYYLTREKAARKAKKDKRLRRAVDVPFRQPSPTESPHIRKWSLFGSQSNSSRESTASPSSSLSSKKSIADVFKGTIDKVMHPRRNSTSERQMASDATFVQDEEDQEFDEIPPPIEKGTTSRARAHSVSLSRRPQSSLKSDSSLATLASDKDLPFVPGSQLPNTSDASMATRQRKSGFMATFKRRVKTRSKTETNLASGAESEKKASGFFSPSMAMLRSLASRIKINRKDRDTSQDQPGAATADVKTAYFSNVFTIRNTTPLPVEAIRTELLRAFSRVDNLESIEQPGGFLLKYFELPQTTNAVNETKPPPKPEDKSSMFASMWAMLKMTPAETETPPIPPKKKVEDKTLPRPPTATYLDLPPVPKNIGPVSIPKDMKPEVQLEVSIRRLPFSKLHGLQFRKLTGDPWKVRNRCCITIFRLIAANKPIF